MGTVSLRPASDNDVASLSFSTGTTGWDLIEEDPDSASDADYVFNTTTNGEDIAWIGMDSLPATWAAATVAAINYRYETTGWAGDTWTLGLQVFAVDKTTAFTTEVTQTGVGTNVTPTTTSGGAINAAGLAGDWSTALIRIRLNIARDKGADGGAVRVHAIELNMTHSDLESKVDVPTRLNSSTLRTTTASLQGDQYGKYIVPQLPWVNPAMKAPLAAAPDLGTGCAFSPDGRFLAVTHPTTPYITVYERSGTTFTKVSALPAGQGNGNDCSWSPDGRFLALVDMNTPFVTVYERSGVTFTKVSALPAPEDSGRGCDFSPDGRFLAVAHDLSPYITVYERSGAAGTTFTKVSALTAPDGNGRDCVWSPDGRFLAVTTFSTPYITVYERSGTTFTKVSALTAPESLTQYCSFSPDGRFLAVVHLTSPFITVYERDGTTFTKVTALTALDGIGNGCDWSPDGRLLAAAHETTPFITVYERSGTTFTKVTSPTVPAGAGNTCAFSPDGRFLAVGHDTTPFITVYETSGLTPREGYLWMEDPGER